MKTIQMLVGICTLSLAAVAGPVLWTVDLTFSDGGTATGTFDFDADAGTACTTGNSPCGVYSNVDIVTTTGTSLPGVTYTIICGVGGGLACTGVSPDSTEVLFLTSWGADLTGDQGLALFFLASGLLPPDGLSDAGGIYDMSGIAGVAQESFCSNAGCYGPTEGNARVSTEGTVFALVTPEPSTALLLAAPLAMLGLARFLARGRRA